MAASENRIALTAPSSPPPLQRTVAASVATVVSVVAAVTIDAVVGHHPRCPSEYRRKGFYVNGLSSAGSSAAEALDCINKIVGGSDIELHEIEYSKGRVHLDYRISQLCERIRSWFADRGKQDSMEQTPQIALFGHSAGTYIVAQAYEQIKGEHGDKIRVVLFGGIQSIKDPHGREGVLELSHKKDYIAYWGYFGMSGYPPNGKVDIEITPPEGASFMQHDSKDYLSNPVVQEAIRWAMEPD